MRVDSRRVCSDQERDDAVRQITVEARFYPFVLIDFHGQPTATDYGVLFESLAALSRKALRDETRYVSISTAVQSLSASDRKLVASLRAKQAEEVTRPIVGKYALVDNTLARGILTALHWLSPSLGAPEAVGSVEEAMASAAARLREHGIAVDGARVAGAGAWLRAAVKLAGTSRAVSL